MVFFILEEDIERRERTIDTGNVLLQFHFLRVGQHLVTVDLGLHDAETVTDHHDLVEERLDRDRLGSLEILSSEG